MIYIAWPFLVEHGFLFREGRQTYGLIFLALLCKFFLSFPILVVFGERFLPISLCLLSRRLMTIRLSRVTYDGLEELGTSVFVRRVT